VSEQADDIRSINKRFYIYSFCLLFFLYSLVFKTEHTITIVCW